MKLNINLAHIVLHQDSQRPVSHHHISSRLPSKKEINLLSIQSCLDTLDIFRDLLEGIPHQKNRVVRDVSKNIQVKHYSQNDIIYDVGDVADSVYFCLSGSVSICIEKSVAIQRSNSHSEQQQTTRSRQNNSKLSPSIMTSPSILTNFSSIGEAEVQYQIVQQEIDMIEAGQGFGQAQFIGQMKRQVRAKAKSSSTLVGKLQIQHFAQVLQNYRKRVYYKKRDMFQKCALFANLPSSKLQFIINHTKPMSLGISQKLFAEGEYINTVYLVNKGQISLWKSGVQSNSEINLTTIDSDDADDLDDQQNQEENGIDSNILTKSKSVILQSTENLTESQPIKAQGHSSVVNKGGGHQSKVFSTLLKIKNGKCPLPNEKNDKVFMGLLSQGCFVGDMQLVLGIPSMFNAICKTEKAEIYYLDRRIIKSQMTNEEIEEASKYYLKKKEYLNEKIGKYKQAKRKLKRQKEIDLLPPLSKEQIQLKRKLMHRHIQQKPSLIGHSSPRDIEKMILRKQKRVIKQPEVSRFPILELFPNHSVKKRSISPHAPTSFKPISIVQTQGKRKNITEPDQSSFEVKSSTINPEQKSSADSGKFKSMLIKIQPKKISLKEVRRGHQQNMAAVSQILGRYKKCENQLTSLNKVIKKLQKGTA